MRTALAFIETELYLLCKCHVLWEPGCITFVQNAHLVAQGHAPLLEHNIHKAEIK